MTDDETSGDGHMTSGDRHDAFAALALPDERQAPRPSFARSLRARLVDALQIDPSGAAAPSAPPIPTIDLPARRPTMSTTTSTDVDAPDAAPSTTAAGVPVRSRVTPYLAAADGAAALDWYATAFGAVESFRVVGDDGKLGHAEFVIGEAAFMLSDEYPDLGVHAPTTLGGSTTTLHLEVADADAVFAAAVDAGAASVMEPADQPHGHRMGTLVDPYGHRWMLSQPLEEFDVDAYAARSEGTEYRVEVTDRAALPDGAAGTAGVGSGGIWASVYYTDALAGVRFMVDVLGFEERLVVPGEVEGTVAHSELVWPEGGVCSPGTYDPDNEFVAGLRPGDQSLYVITADPHAVWDRCVAAGVQVVREPEAPHYDPDGMGFAIRDPEGNIWSFGSYAGS